MSTTGTLRLNATDTLILQRAVRERIETLRSSGDDTRASERAMEAAQLVRLADKLTEYAAGKGWI